MHSAIATFPHRNLPMGQVNAHLQDELVMRVGIPHKGGSLPFHAFNEGYPAMVSAAAFWKGSKFVVPEVSNLYELDWALDSAGFTAVANWQSKGTQPAWQASTLGAMLSTLSSQR